LNDAYYLQSHLQKAEGGGVITSLMNV